jgi:Zn-dependent alcohol dehydrogenase
VKSRAAILRAAPGKWEVVELEVEDPRQDEVMVELAACGLCRSEVHLASGAFPNPVWPGLWRASRSESSGPRWMTSREPPESGG